MKRGKRTRSPETHGTPASQLTFQVARFCGTIKKAQDFAKTHGKDHFLGNPACGASASQAHVLFIKGLQRLGYMSIQELLALPKNFRFGFHGTDSEANIASILENGFDPSMRSTQIHGAGEYFDIRDGRLAKQYQGDTDCIIVVLLVTNDILGNPVPEFSKHDSSKIALVNNPTEDEDEEQLPYTFCLPCGLASTNELSVLVQKKIWLELRLHFRALQIDQPQAVGQSLYFKDYHGKWSKQCKLIQKEADAALRQGNTEFTVADYTITDHNGVKKKFDYEFDLRAMTQKNLQTATTRALKWK